MDGVVASAVKWNVDYIMLTAWHGDVVTLYPSQVQQDYGLNRYTDRDVIGELLDALDAVNKTRDKKIEFYLYTHPGQGYALSAVDQAKIGWGDYDAYNTYLSRLYYELVDRYTNRGGKLGISGLFFDEGSVLGDMDLFIDYPRLRDACKRGGNDVVLIQNYYGNLYSQDVICHEAWLRGTTYSKSFLNLDSEMWEASENGSFAVTLTKDWWPSAPVSEESAVYPQFDFASMFRYAVLTASLNAQGGGVSWSFGNYARNSSDEPLWETGVDDVMTKFSEYYDKYYDSLFGTVPGKAYPTPSGGGLSSLKRLKLSNPNAWGVSTDSKDGKTTYLHVLYAPKGNVLELEAPANGATFSSASVLGSSAAVKMEKLSKGGYRLTLPEGFTWDSIDTVIALKAGSDSGLDIIDNDDDEMDFDKYTVILRDGRAYVRKGTTYAQMAAFLEASGEYLANFINEDGTEEITSDSPQWNTAALEGMILRLITSDYSDMTDYIITPVSDEPNTPGKPGTPDTDKSPSTGDTGSILLAVLMMAFAGLCLTTLILRRKRNFR